MTDNSRGDCVIWAGEDERVPDAIVNALSRRGLCAIVVRSPGEAMVEVAQRSARAVILTPGVGSPWTEQLQEAVNVYHPATAVWRLAIEPSGGLQLLSAAGSSPAPTPEPPRKATADGEPTSQGEIAEARAHAAARRRNPRGRLHSLLVQAPSGFPDEPAQVSEEELTMLLGDDQPFGAASHDPE